MKYDIPVIKIEGDTLPEVWEKAVIATWNEGLAIKTEYDKEADPASRDCTMVMVIEDPLKEPRIHRAFPGGLEDLEVYRQEVVLGIHDHWIKPEEGKWTYTYHQRLFGYAMEDKVIDQMDYIIKKLSQTPYSRRAQAITWNSGTDPETDDPPCLQRVWFRMVGLSDGSYSLNMNTHWRSRDAYKASFMNIFALTDLQKTMAEKISENIKKKVNVGRYVDISDSFHIYGSYAEEFKQFLKTVAERPFAEKTWTTQFAQPFFEEARVRLQNEKRSI
ncbi:MAG: thymidylate synthase [Candidatus Omnitrophica bacterium]|nr:thymidylate synthase [Candidatus Omnitrophota bacterium]